MNDETRQELQLPYVQGKEEVMAEAVVGRFPDAVAARLNKFDQEIQAIVSRKILYAEGALAALGVDVAGVNVRLSEDSTGYTVESKAD